VDASSPSEDRVVLSAARRDAACGFQDIRVYGRDGISDARLVWKVCHQCERGVISKISLSPEVQRQGLGTRLVDRALLDGPGYRWTTSSQSPDGRAFFRAMTARTGAEFAAGPSLSAYGETARLFGLVCGARQETHYS
jgi:GNAT superfamily N-acetyltransferase